MFNLQSSFPIVFGLGVLLASTTAAQTPPNYTPSTNTTLHASFGPQPIFPPGVRIPLNLLQTPPTLHLSPPTSLTTKSLVLLIDLDTPYGAPNNSLAPYLHWLQADISPTALNATTGSNSSASPALIPFVHPNPPAVSKVHRYVLMAFEQPMSNGTFKFPAGYEDYGVGEGLASNRTKFDLDGFVKAAGLRGPREACWFTAVPELGNKTMTVMPFEGAGGRLAGSWAVAAVAMGAAMRLVL